MQRVSFVASTFLVLAACGREAPAPAPATAAKADPAAPSPKREWDLDNAVRAPKPPSPPPTPADPAVQQYTASLGAVKHLPEGLAPAMTAGLSAIAPALRRCYDRALGLNPALRQHLLISFTLDAKGNATAITTAALDGTRDAELGTCVEAAMALLEVAIPPGVKIPREPLMTTDLLLEPPAIMTAPLGK